MENHENGVAWLHRFSLLWEVSPVVAKKHILGYLMLVPFLLMMGLLIAACLYVLLQSFGYVPAFDLYDLTLDYYRQVFARPEFLQSLLVSVKSAFFSALWATLLGTLLCAALVRGKHTRGPLVYLIRLPILVPHTVVALFAVLLLGQTGLLARIAFSLGLLRESSRFPMILYTPEYTGVTLAYLWKEIPFVAYFTLALMSGISEKLGQAAENLGASPLKSFFHITLPLSLPAIAKSSLMILLFAFSGYELPLLLGSTLPKALPIYAAISYQSPELKTRPYAMALFGVLMLLSMAVSLLYGILTGRLVKKLGGSR